jgi:hypothetical protein
MKIRQMLLTFMLLALGCYFVRINGELKVREHILLVMPLNFAYLVFLWSVATIFRR